MAYLLRRSARSFLNPSTRYYSSARSVGISIGGVGDGSVLSAVGVSLDGAFKGNLCDEKSYSSSASSYNVDGGSSYMRGLVFSQPNSPLTIEDFDMPRPKANEVLIKTKGGFLLG